MGPSGAESGTTNAQNAAFVGVGETAPLFSSVSRRAERAQRDPLLEEWPRRET